jgi:RNA-directed DNA polymerase
MHWIKNRYFRRTKTRKWVFGTEVVEPKGDKKWVELWRASTTPIRRHRKIKADANPFDLNWETYFEERSGWKMAQNLQKRKKLKYIWENQDRKCPVCKQPFIENEWYLHYRTPRYLGGSESYENLVLLHPNCHSLVHAKELVV